MIQSSVMKALDDPGPLPEGADFKTREKHKRATEKFMTEDFKAGVSKVPAKVDPTDQRLQRLRREAGAFMELHSPAKASLWLALQRPVAELISDVEQTRRYAAAQRAGKVRGIEFKAPRQSAIVELGQRLVVQALDGDSTAMGMIMDRIEGKPGLRKGDDDPNDTERRKRQQDLSTALVKALTRDAIATKVDDAKIVDVEVEEIVSNG